MGNKSPMRKVSCDISIGEKQAVYVATKTREHIVVKENEEVVGSIYVTQRLLRELDIHSDKIETTGEVDDFLWIVLEEREKPENVKVTWHEKAKGNVSKIKGMKYETYDTSAITKDNYELKIGGSLEDYIYENVPMESLREENDLSWADSKNYRILVEDGEIYEWIDGLAKTNEIVGFDTETTGLSINRTKLDKLVGICMSYEDDSGVYFPIAHERFENVKMGGDKLLELLKPYCDRHSDKAKDLVLHNGKFDWKVMKMHGWELNIVYDTMLRQMVKEVGKSKDVRTLKGITSYVFGYDVVELEDMYVNRTKKEIEEIRKIVFNGKVPLNSITKRKLEHAEKFNDLFDFRFASYDFVALYGCADADFPRMLHKEMDKEWEDELNFIYNLELGLVPSIAEQEYYGIRANRGKLEKLRIDTEKDVKELEDEIFEEAGERFNINSGKQKAEILYNKLGCPVLPNFRTKKGNLSTSSDVLKVIAEYKDNEGKSKFPIAKLLIKYNKKEKLLNSFYGKLPVMIEDGFLFSQYRQDGAETGRLSCHSPNLQQTEGTSRFSLEVDSNEHYLLICDYSQVEYRLMAGLAGEKKVVDFFKNNPEADYHILAYANMMNKAYEDVTSEERKQGKTLNFGTSYGLEDASLARSLYGNDSKFAQAKANMARKQYFDGVPNIRDYFERKKDEAEVARYAETLFGRRRNIPEFRNGTKHLSPFMLGSGRRKAGNHPVQGTAADIMKIAMTRLRESLRALGYDENMARLVLNVHDEVAVQFHKSINMWYAVKIMREAMEIDFSEQGIPPLYVGAVLGYTWGDGTVDENEAPVLLMDEKVAEIEKLMEQGKELPVYDDPKAEWDKEVRKFSLRVIQEELENGYEDKETGKIKEIKTYSDAMKNVRLAKYSHELGDAGYQATIDLMESKTVDEVYEKLDKYKTYQGKRYAVALRRIKDTINEKKYTKIEEAITNSTILYEKDYYGEHGLTVVQRLLNDTPKEVYTGFAEYIKQDGYNPIEIEVKEKKEGRKLEGESEETVLEYVKKNLLRYQKEINTITFKLEYEDLDVLNLVEKILVPVTHKDMFKDIKHCDFAVIWETGQKQYTTGYIVFRVFAPILRELLVRHVMGVGYKGMEEKIEKVGDEITLTEEEISEITNKRLQKIYGKYNKNKFMSEIENLQYLRNKLKEIN